MAPRELKYFYNLVWEFITARLCFFNPFPTYTHHKKTVLSPCVHCIAIEIWEAEWSRSRIVVFKNHRSDLQSIRFQVPKIKLTLLHFLFSSVLTLMTPAFIAGSKLPRGTSCFADMWVPGSSLQSGYCFGIWYQARGREVGIWKRIQSHLSAWQVVSWWQSGSSGNHLNGRALLAPVVVKWLAECWV